MVPWTTLQSHPILPLFAFPSLKITHRLAGRALISSLDIEESDSLALDCEHSRLARWHVLGCRYFDELCHNAWVGLMVAERSGSESAQPFQRLKPKAYPRRSRPATPLHSISNAESISERWLSRVLLVRPFAASVWLGRSSSSSWFVHAEPAPLFPIASTGQPSIASLQRTSSSGVVGCLKT